MKRYSLLLSTLFIYNLQANRETTPNEIRLVSQEESKSCESQKITVEPSVPKWKKYLRNIQYGIIGTQLTMSVWIILNISTLPKNILSSIPEPVQKAISDFGYTTQDFKIYESPPLGVNAFVTFLDKLIIIGKDLLKYGGKDIPHFLIGHEIAHKELSHPLKRILFLGSLIAGQFLFHKGIQFAKNKYNSNDNPYLYSLIHYGDKINTFLNYNPFIRMLLTVLPLAYLARCQEKEADVLSLVRTENITGAVKFFNFAEIFHPDGKFRGLFLNHPAPQERITNVITCWEMIR